MTHIDEATEEDRFYQIDRWAKLFKATTWMELKNLTKGDDYMAQAAKELYDCNADDLIKQQCRAREDYYREQRTLHKAIKDATEARDRLAVEKEQAIAEKKQVIAEKEQAFETLKAKELIIAEAQKQHAEDQKRITESLKEIAELKEQLRQHQG